MNELTPEELDGIEWATASQRAKENPLWQKAKAAVEAVPAIRVFHHVGRLNDALLFVGEMLQIQAKARDAIVRAKIRGPAKLFEENRDLIRSSDPRVRDAMVRLFLRFLEAETGKKVDEYPRWTLNQGLVILCTRFDVCLEEIVDTVYQGRVELLHTSAEAKTISLKTVLAAGSTEALLTDIRQREVRAFAFESIDKRFEYLRTRLHLDTARVFDWSLLTSEEVRTKFAGWDLRRLSDIYDYRHRIVHRDELPVGSLEELADIQEFLEKIMFSISVLARDKHGVDLDSEQTVMIARTYDELRRNEAASSQTSRVAPAGSE